MRRSGTTRFVMWLVGTAVALVGVGTLSADVIPGALYGVNSQTGGGFLAIIDKTDGSVTNIGPTGIKVDGLAVFQAVTIFAADNTNFRLVTLDSHPGGVSSVIGYGRSSRSDFAVRSCVIRPPVYTSPSGGCPATGRGCWLPPPRIAHDRGVDG